MNVVTKYSEDIDPEFSDDDTPLENALRELFQPEFKLYPNDGGFCEDIWGHLQNKAWKKDNIYYGMTFRQAGHVIANLIKEAQPNNETLNTLNYMTFYCCRWESDKMNENLIRRMEERGWTLGYLTSRGVLIKE